MLFLPLVEAGRHRWENQTKTWITPWYGILPIRLKGSFCLIINCSLKNKLNLFKFMKKKSCEQPCLLFLEMFSEVLSEKCRENSEVVRDQQGRRF